MSKGLNVEDPSGMSVSQVTDEVLYAGLIEMQELWGVGGRVLGPTINT